MVFQKYFTLPLTPQNTIINAQSQIKLLGFHFNNRLSLNPHISHLIKILNALFFSIKTIKHLLNNQDKITFYYAYILPHLLYTLPFINTCNKTYIKTLHKKLSSILKYLFNYSRYEHNHTVYEDLRLKTIYDIIKTSNIKYCDKLKNKHFPQALNTMHENTFNGPLKINARTQKIQLFHSSNTLNNFLKNAIIEHNNSI